jgi:hypothetical protein
MSKCLYHTRATLRNAFTSHANVVKTRQRLLFTPQSRTQTVLNLIRQSIYIHMKATHRKRNTVTNPNFSFYTTIHMRLALRRQTFTLLIYICSHSPRLIITNYHHGPPLTTNTKPEPEQRQRRPDSLPVKRFCKQLPLPRFHVLRTNSRLTPTYALHQTNLITTPKFIIRSTPSTLYMITMIMIMILIIVACFLLLLLLLFLILLSMLLFISILFITITIIIDSG